MSDSQQEDYPRIERQELGDIRINFEKDRIPETMKDFEKMDEEASSEFEKFFNRVSLAAIFGICVFGLLGLGALAVVTFFVYSLL